MQGLRSCVALTGGQRHRRGVEGLVLVERLREPSRRGPDLRLLAAHTDGDTGQPAVLAQQPATVHGILRAGQVTGTAVHLGEGDQALGTGTDLLVGDRVLVVERRQQRRDRIREPARAELHMRDRVQGVVVQRQPVLGGELQNPLHRVLGLRAVADVVLGVSEVVEHPDPRADVAQSHRQPARLRVPLPGALDVLDIGKGIRERHHTPPSQVRRSPVPHPRQRLERPERVLQRCRIVAELTEVRRQSQMTERQQQQMLVVGGPRVHVPADLPAGDHIPAAPDDVRAQQLRPQLQVSGPELGGGRLDRAGPGEPFVQVHAVPGLFLERGELHVQGPRVHTPAHRPARRGPEQSTRSAWVNSPPIPTEGRKST